MEDQKKILEKLNIIEKLLLRKNKEILSVEDLINYTGYKRSYIYKLVHNNVLPYSKPNGKLLFFLKSEIDEWLLKNKNQSDSQIEAKAQDYIFSRKK